MKSKLRYAVVFVVGMLVGLAAGAWGLRALWHHGPPAPEKILKMMDCKLHFTEDQKAKALVILSEETAKMKAARDETSAKFESLRDQGAERMRGLLDPKQQATFDEMKKKFDKHRRPFLSPGECTPPPYAPDKAPTK